MTYDLNRFIHAQKNTYQAARQELAAGRKSSHWMWFIFPQIAGLGRSPTARHYELQSIAEAQAYLAHPLLGTRIIDLTRILVDDVNGRSAEEIFGYPDYLKFHSSMTLFDIAALEMPDQYNNDAQNIFGKALDKFYGGERDSKTLSVLNVQN